MTLREQLRAKLTAAKSALDAGNSEEYATLKAEAEALAQRVKDSDALTAMENDIGDDPTPIRPTLPAKTSGRQGTLPSVPDPKDEEPQTHPATKAAYVKRFGTIDAEVHQIMTEVHGGNYIEKYFEHKVAFRNYLRRGEKGLTPEQDRLLRELVLTPQWTQIALEEGIDSIKSYKATMVEASDILGGYTVPVDFNSKFIEELPEQSIMRNLATVITTSRDSVEMLKATGGNGKYTSPVRVSWVPETMAVGDMTSQNVQFGVERINVHTSMAEAVLSQNLVEDTAFPIESYLASKLAEAAAIDENDQFLTGSGVGRPWGILPGGANTRGMPEVNSGLASAIDWDSLIKLTWRVPAQYRNNNARWLAEKATYEYLALLKDGNGQYLWRRDWGNNATEGSQGHMAPLQGYGTLEHETMPSVAAQAYPMLFGDFSAYIIVDRIGMSIQRYLDGTQARQNTVLYVMKRRLGGQLMEPWKITALKVSA